jgi:hypothetical protein
MITITLLLGCVNKMSVHDYRGVGEDIWRRVPKNVNININVFETLTKVLVQNISLETFTI